MRPFRWRVFARFQPRRTPPLNRVSARARRAGRAAAIPLTLGGAGLLLSLTSATPVEARTWHVYIDGSGDAPFIQAAVDSAQDGDVVLVGPGTYPEDWVGVENKSIELRSSDGPEVTTVKHIYGYGADRPTNLVVSGFMVEGGEQISGGVAFFLLSSLVLNDCIVRGFDEQSLVEKADDGLVSNCLFEDNRNAESDDYGGGALRIILSPNTPGVSVVGCTFRHNEYPFGIPGYGIGGGAIAAIGPVQGSEITIRDCLFDGNESRSGGAIYAIGNVWILHNTFVNNISEDGAVLLSDTRDYGAYHNIFAFNSRYGLYDAVVDHCGCNAFWQNLLPDQDLCTREEGYGTFDVDPLFCDPGAGNYRLQKGSPMAGPFDEETHFNCEAPIGAFGEGCVPSPVVKQSWGEIKARFSETTSGK